MTLSLQKSFIAILFLVLFAILFSSCATPTPRKERIQNLVTSEYFLQKAGFQEWPVNDTTPKRKALLDSIPRGKITTFEKGGLTYHAYTDENAQRLYIGDAVAYQKYEAMTHGRKLCERVTAPDSSKFWSCYQEYKALGGTQLGK